MGAGTIGLLATLVMWLRGLEVVTFGKIPKPYLNSELIEALGATYVTSDEQPVAESPKRYEGGFDIIFEATGYSPIVFDSMQALARNGVLVLSSVTGGARRVEVPADKINLGFVLGNKVMVGTVNANREYFESGVGDMSKAELQYPGWLSRLLTDPVNGLDNYRELFDKLTNAKDAIKVYCQVAEMTWRVGSGRVVRPSVRRPEADGRSSGFTCFLPLPSASCTGGLADSCGKS
jgi:glucose 1-dehydrogenase